MAKCTACGKFLATKGVAACNNCSNKYHLACVHLKESPNANTVWKCTTCKKKATSTSTAADTDDVCFEDAAAEQTVHQRGDSALLSGTDIGLELRLIRSELRSMKVELKNELMEIRKEVADLREAASTCREQLDGLEGRVEALESRESSDTSADLRSKFDQTVRQLKNELNDREQEVMASDLEISNLPEDSGENVTHTVELVARKLGVTLEPRDTVFAERVGPKPNAVAAKGESKSVDAGRELRGGRGRRIVVRLARRELKDELLRSARVRRGATSADLGLAAPPRRFYLNERLTRTNRQLLYRARQTAEKLGWRYTWSKRGKILTKQADVDEQGTSTVDAESAPVQNGDTEPTEPRYNGHIQKRLQRLETVPDIKRDTSGITTQYIATGIVNLGAFAAGVCVAWSSSALPLLTSEPLEPSPTRDVITAENSTPSLLSDSIRSKFELTVAEASWAASLLCLGAVWGAVPAGLISEYFGRKKTLLYLALPLVVSWIMVASSPNVYGLYVGRFVGGIAVGAFSVGIPPYIEDIAEKQILPTLANFYHVHFSCGVLFGYIIGLVESTSWISTLCASVPTAFFVAFIFLPESPAYFMTQGKFHQAKAALRYFRGIDNDIDSEIKALKEHLRSSAKNRVTFKQLLSTRSTVKALVVSFGLMIFQQMSGIYPVLFYAKSIFETFAISLNPPGAVIILGFCLVSSTYFSTMLLKMVRRRVLLMVSFTAMAVNLGCLAVYYHLKASNMSLNQTWVPLFTLCLFVSFYAAGVGPIPWLMLREIFPPNVTRRATAITAGFHWFLAFGVTKLYQNLVDMVKPGWTLWHFAVTCLIGTIFVYFFVPETKDRSLEEIQNEFEGIHKKRKHRHVIEVEAVSDA